MRLNRGTIALVVIGIIVIVGVIVFNNYQENNPGATPTATPQAGGPLFADLTSDALAQVVVRDNSNGARVVLARTGDGLWELGEPDETGLDVEALEALAASLEATPEVTPEATALPVSTPDPELDQMTVQSAISGLIALNASDRFDSDQLEGFELSNPAYSILITTTDGTVYVLHVGGENPSGNRYYAVQEQISVGEMTPEPSVRAEETEMAATEEVIEGEAVATVIVEPGESIGAPGENVLGGGATTPDEPTAEATEVDVVENVTEAVEFGEQIEATNAAVAESMSEGTTEEATEEATVETTPEAGGTLPPLPTPTPAPLAEPLVTLSGTRTINTIPKTTIDQLIGYITFPPYFVPTPTPTLPITLPEITEEATVEATFEATPEATEEAAEEPTTQPTSEPTEEATAES